MIHPQKHQPEILPPHHPRIMRWGSKGGRHTCVQVHCVVPPWFPFLVTFCGTTKSNCSPHRRKVRSGRTPGANNETPPVPVTTLHFLRLIVLAHTARPDAIQHLSFFTRKKSQKHSKVVAASFPLHTMELFSAGKFPAYARC